MSAMHVIRENLAISIVCLAFFCGLVYFATRPHAQATESFFTELTLPLKDYGGSTVRLSNYATRPLIVFTWATWCPFCEEQFRELSAVKQRYGSDLVVVAVNRAEPFADAKQFTDKMLLPEGIVYLLDPDDAFYKKIAGFAMPELLFIDRHSTIVRRSRGPLTQQELDEAAATLVR
jgi:thiol-disulfide isomerase/thioredoxin